MLGFISEELIWAMTRERQEEARRVRPHTARRGDPERSTHQAEQWRAELYWSAPALRHRVERGHA